MTVGKTSFPDEQLLENYQAVIEELIRAKPSAAKGKYLRTIVMASTQGPGIKVDPARTRDLVEAEEPARVALAAATFAVAWRARPTSPLLQDPGWPYGRKSRTGGAV